MAGDAAAGAPRPLACSACAVVVADAAAAVAVAARRRAATTSAMTSAAVLGEAVAGAEELGTDRGWAADGATVAVALPRSALTGRAGAAWEGLGGAGGLPFAGWRGAWARESDASRDPARPWQVLRVGQFTGGSTRREKRVTSGREGGGKECRVTRA